MLHDFIEFERRLERAEVLSLRSIDGTVIECLSGSLWLTEQGGDDHWLAAGERYVLHGNGCTVVEGLANAEVRVVKPAAPTVGWFTRLWHELGGRPAQRECDCTAVG
ncbi:DUF2917 domain-containing protein [Chitinimonas lacunae]|uniref:DUF2917 domain-containing protein n=1 Tax=Chitinimonas lacunae TaxID=1963018 RepID=A0ABV8MQ47_9NEIS